MKIARLNTGIVGIRNMIRGIALGVAALVSAAAVSGTGYAQQPGTLQIGIDNGIPGVAERTTIITRDHNLHFYTLDTTTGTLYHHGPWLNYTVQLNNSRNHHVGMAEDQNGNVYSLHKDGYIYRLLNGGGTILNNSNNLWDGLHNRGTEVVARHIRTNTWYVWASPTHQYPDDVYNRMYNPYASMPMPGLAAIITY